MIDELNKTIVETEKDRCEIDFAKDKLNTAYRLICSMICLTDKTF